MSVIENEGPSRSGDPRLFDDNPGSTLPDDAAFADLLDAERSQGSGAFLSKPSRYKFWRQMQERFPDKDQGRNSDVFSGAERRFWLMFFAVGIVVSLMAGAGVAWWMSPDIPPEFGIDQGVALAISLKPYDMASGKELADFEVEANRPFGFRVAANHEGYVALFIANDDAPSSVLWEQQLLDSNGEVVVGTDENAFATQIAAGEGPVRYCAVAADSPSRLKTFVNSIAQTREQRIAESCITVRLKR